MFVKVKKIEFKYEEDIIIGNTVLKQDTPLGIEVEYTLILKDSSALDGIITINCDQDVFNWQLRDIHGYIIEKISGECK